MGWFTFGSTAIAVFACLAIYANWATVPAQTSFLAVDKRRFQGVAHASIALKNAAVPSLVEIPALDTSSWQEIDQLQKFLPQEVAGAKISQHRHFTYYDSSRPWAAAHFPSRGYDVLPGLPTSEFLARVFGDSNTSTTSASDDKNRSTYVYHTHRMHPSGNSLLRALEEARFTSASPNINLWFGSAGVVAVLHYDIEHNLFVQLRGEKVFYIAEPAAALWLGEGDVGSGLHWHSSQHPSWRQAQLVPAPMNEAGGVGNATLTLLNELASHGFKVWEVRLRAGDMLYIPPYYLHTVVSDTASASLNVWSGSEEYAAARELEKQSLPFDVKADTATRLAAVAALFHRAVHEIAPELQISQLLEAFRRRNRKLDSSQLLSGDLEDCAAAVEWSKCSPFESTNGNIREWADASSWQRLDQAARQKVLKSATNVQRLLARISQPAVRVLMLFDYLEDILDFVLKNDSSPCSFDRFVQHCLSRPS